jgi:predicted molibdopterin-dependent oxidoreductase YjgC
MHMLQIENPKTSNPLTRFKPLSTPKDRMPYKSKDVKPGLVKKPQRCILVNRGVSEACQFKKGATLSVATGLCFS